MKYVNFVTSVTSVSSALKEAQLALCRDGDKVSQVWLFLKKNNSIFQKEFEKKNRKKKYFHFFF